MDHEPRRRPGDRARLPGPAATGRAGARGHGVVRPDRSRRRVRWCAGHPLDRAGRAADHRRDRRGLRPRRVVRRVRAPGGDRLGVRGLRRGHAVRRLRGQHRHGSLVGRHRSRRVRRRFRGGPERRSADTGRVGPSAPLDDRVGKPGSPRVAGRCASPGHCATGERVGRADRAADSESIRTCSRSQRRPGLRRRRRAEAGGVARRGRARQLAGRGQGGRSLVHRSGHHRRPVADLPPVGRQRQGTGLDDGGRRRARHLVRGDRGHRLRHLRRRSRHLPLPTRGDHRR